MESAVQPLPVSQPNHMVYNPHYGQQMQYQNNAYNQYYTHQPHMPVQHLPEQNMPAQQMPVQQMPAQPMSAQEMPMNMATPSVAAAPVNDPPAYLAGSTEEPEATETEQKTIENEKNSENTSIELEVGSGPNVTVPVEDASSETTTEANF